MFSTLPFEIGFVSHNKYWTHKSLARYWEFVILAIESSSWCTKPINDLTSALSTHPDAVGGGNVKLLESQTCHRQYECFFVCFFFCCFFFYSFGWRQHDYNMQNVLQRFRKKPTSLQIYGISNLPLLPAPSEPFWRSGFLWATWYEVLLKYKNGKLLVILLFSAIRKQVIVGRLLV